MRWVLGVLANAYVFLAVVVAIAMFAIGTVGVSGQDGGGASGGDSPDPPVDVPALVEDDDDPTNVESTDDVGGDLGDDLAKNSPVEQWMVWMSLAIPWVMSVINRRGWGKDVQTGAMVAVSAIAAIGASYLRGELDNFQYTTTALFQLVVGVQVAYKTFSMLPGVGNVMRGIEEKTGGMPADVAKVDALGVPPNPGR